MDKLSRVQQSYSGVCRATRSAGAYEEQSMPSSSTPSLFSTAVQSVCGIIDHGGHCRQLEDLQAVNRTLEVELERHIKMRDIRIQFANPEYYWDNMKHARQAKRNAEKQAEELQERMSALNKEFSEAILLPIAQEKQIMHLREELDTLKKACEAEKQQRSDANESQAEVIEKLRKVWLLLETERAKLRTHTEKLHDTAHLVDLLSSENCGIRERSKELEQQFELARAAAEDAESRIKKMEEGVAAYCDQVMAYDASMKNNHQMEIDGFNNALMTAADSLKVKESRIEELEADVHARDMQLEDIQLALKDAIETSSIKFDQVVADKEAEIRLLNDRLLTMEQGSAGLDAALRQADKSNAEANVVLEELRRDLGSKNADIQNLRTALASSVSYAKAVHKLQGHIEDLRRNLKDKNLCIDDLKSQIKVLQSPPAVPNPRLAELSEVNARLEKEVSEVKMQRDAALATIEETATKTAKADLVQANLVEKIQVRKYRISIYTLAHLVS
ncbi:hypothetical protein FRC02_005168 [Tulasnella sp. 418]|nr:hypothetical protein FRC02_005168 [Tulasnella sp. 418]